MFVPVYGSGDRALEILDAAGAVVDKREIHWTTFSEWSEFEAVQPLAWASIVALQADDDSRLKQLGALPQAARDGLIVLAPVGFRLPMSEGAHVMYASPERLNTDFAWELYKVRSTSFFGDQVVRIERAPDVSRLLKRFVTTALLADPPLATVQALADRCRRSPQDLWYHWRAWALTGTPKKLLMRIVLARAVLGRPSGASWERAACKVGATDQRLRRNAGAVFDMSLDELSNHGEQYVMRRFADHLTECFGLMDCYRGEQIRRLQAPAARVAAGAL